jgi:hypothetical protein
MRRLSPVSVFFAWLISGVVLGILCLVALPLGHASSLPFYFAIAVGGVGGTLHARQRAREKQSENAG